QGQAGVVPRAVRRALRARPRLHADRGGCPLQGRLRHVAEAEGRGTEAGRCSGNARRPAGRNSPRRTRGGTDRSRRRRRHFVTPGTSPPENQRLISRESAMAEALTTASPHDDHDHKPHGWRRWVYATNHKDIGTMYLIFACIMFFIGGGAAMLIRLELFS